MKKFYYYAELNDNNVCIKIVSDTTKKVGSDRHIEIPEYNETLVYKKWLGDQWSSESYEPSVDTVIQDRLNDLEEENMQLSTQVTNLGFTLDNVNATNETLIQSIAELTAMIAMLQTPTE